VDRIKRLVDSMRRLGRGGSGDETPGEVFDPCDLAQEVVTLLEREANRANVTLHLERDPQTPKITAVRDHIQQVMLNLTMNAIQASGDGGVVAIRVFRDLSELGGICLEFSDSGPGIPEENLERIFDPFFSTKGPDQGTGLGLMICHRLVADHDGAIEVTSREGEGATLRVRLPVGSGEGPGGI
jgi:signal transduction histidine kinase